MNRDSKIIQKVMEHQDMIAFHQKEATRLIASLKGGVSTPPKNKKRETLSKDFKSMLARNMRKNTVQR